MQTQPHPQDGKSGLFRSALDERPQDSFDGDGLQSDTPRAGSQGEEIVKRPICVTCFQLSNRSDGEPLRCEAVDGSGLGIVCCLAGKINMQISNDGKITEHSILAGRLGCYACSHGWCQTRCASEECARILKLRFSHATLHALMGGTTVPRQDMAPVYKSRFIGMVRDIAPQMNPVIDSLQDALRCRQNADLLVLAKALELLYLHFSSDPQVNAATIDPRNEKAIQKARFLLTHHLETPPSLSELANAVGMSVSKLKMLFPKICGMPPYEYLRKMRMHRAMELLHQDGMNVTEAAMAVGYSSISYFAKAFHREYAIYPSQVRRRPTER
jgi:AraC-like DNA-binding protein